MTLAALPGYMQGHIVAGRICALWDADLTVDECPGCGADMRPDPNAQPLEVTKVDHERKVISVSGTGTTMGATVPGRMTKREARSLDRMLHDAGAATALLATDTLASRIRRNVGQVLWLGLPHVIRDALLRAHVIKQLRQRGPVRLNGID